MGRYVHNNLIAGETVVFETRLHWIVFFSWKSLFTLLLSPLIARANSEFAITNRRIIVKVGFIARHTMEMNLAKVETVSIDQTIWGRLCGYGSLTLIGTGGTRESFHKITRPMEFRKAFQELQA